MPQALHRPKSLPQIEHLLLLRPPVQKYGGEGHGQQEYQCANEPSLPTRVEYMLARSSFSAKGESLLTLEDDESSHRSEQEQ